MKPANLTHKSAPQPGSSSKKVSKKQQPSVTTRKQTARVIGDSPHKACQERQTVHLNCQKLRQMLSPPHRSSKPVPATTRRKHSTNFKTSNPSIVKLLQPKSNISILQLKEIQLDFRNKAQLPSTIQQRQRFQEAMNIEKQKSKLRQLIEQGSREHRFLLAKYSQEIRHQNLKKSVKLAKSKSLSSLEQRLPWGCNQERLKQAAMQTLRNISVSLNVIRQRCKSQDRHILAPSPSKIELKKDGEKLPPSEEISKSQSTKPKIKNRRVIQSNLCKGNRGHKQRLSVQESSSSQHQDLRPTIKRVNLAKIIKIQRFWKKRLMRRQMLTLLHILYQPKPKTCEIGINTDNPSSAAQTQSQPTKVSQLVSCLRNTMRPSFESLKAKQKQLLHQKYELLVQARTSEQLELDYVFESEKGISTNLHIINENITCLIRYLLTYYSEELDAELFAPYGLTALQRIKVLNGYYQLDLQDERQFIISDEIIFEFEQNITDDEIDKDRKQYDSIHNKAIFDAFNQAINSIRPYYNTRGQPYPWTVHTNVFVHQSPTSRAILQKAKQSVLASASVLAGLLIEDQDEQQRPKMQKLTFEEYDGLPLHPNAFVANFRQQKITKLIEMGNAREQNSWLWHETQKAELLYSIGEQIIVMLAAQLARAIATINLKLR